MNDKCIVYYTDGNLDPFIMSVVQKQLLRSANGCPIVSVSLQPIAFGENIVLPLTRSYLTMFEEILAGLEASKSEIVFFAEHDILYTQSHFQFTPPKQDVYYYNTNVWKVRMSDGYAIHYDVQQTSGLCAYREFLLQHYRERVRRIEAEWDRLPRHPLGRYRYNMGFEPGTHGRPERIDDFKADSWQSEYPNIDIRHDKNLTVTRWSRDEFKDKRHAKNWVVAEEIPGWGQVKGRFSELLKDVEMGIVP